MFSKNTAHKYNRSIITKYRPVLRGHLGDKKK
jgi:hypothetical protein